MPARNPSSMFRNLHASDIAADSAITVKFVADSVTVPKVKAALKTDIINMTLSFAAAAELGVFKIHFPMKVRIDKIRTVVTKVIGATSAAYVTGGNVSGPSDAGIVTISASATIGMEDEASPTNNNVVAAGSWYALSTAKAGDYAGTIEAYLEYTITP